MPNLTLLISCIYCVQKDNTAEGVLGEKKNNKERCQQMKTSIQRSLGKTKHENTSVLTVNLHTKLHDSHFYANTLLGNVPCTNSSKFI